jgi:methylmalonyl-CoA/ethylmalonyl-CoA epimerase
MFKIDHIGIAVNSLMDAIPVFEAMLGDNPAGRESVPSEDVEVVFFGHGPGRVELLEPCSPESPMARFLEQRGQGLHHVCFRVTDLREALRRLAESGISPITPGIRPGAEDRQVAFLHPRDCGGVLVELVERSD